MNGMPPDFEKVEAAIQEFLDGGRCHDSPAGAAIHVILTRTCQDLARKHPEYAEAFQALAERLGYV